MTLIEVKARKWGWCVFESPGVEPVFLEQDQAIGYAETRARLRTGEGATSNVQSMNRRGVGQCEECQTTARSGNFDLPVGSPSMIEQWTMSCRPGPLGLLAPWS